LGQVPFTSINYGTCTSPEGRIVIKAILDASIDGLGDHETAIFPIMVFKLKDGVNRHEGDPNYDLYLKAIECTSKRMYPNFVNVDATFNKKCLVEGNPDTEACTMGKVTIAHIKLCELTFM
jgi:ribonucleoside-triphosphate reductase